MTNQKTPFHALENSRILEFVNNADGPSAEFITVTPAEADYVMKSRHADNRNIRPKQVDGYARDMINGWDLNGETIKFDETGMLFDGQHRMTALGSLQHLSDIAVLFLVVAGLPVESKDTVDQNIKRTHSDVLKFNGHKNPALLAAIIRKAMQYTAGDIRLHGTAAYTSGETLAFLEEHPELERSTEIATWVYSKMPCAPKSVVGIAHWVFMQADEQTTPWFFERFRDGSDLRDGDPILTLRNKFITERDESQRKYQAAQFAYFIRAFNAVRSGQQLHKITAFGRNGEMPRVQI